MNNTKVNTTSKSQDQNCQMSLVNSETYQQYNIYPQQYPQTIPPQWINQQPIYHPNMIPHRPPSFNIPPPNMMYQYPPNYPCNNINNPMLFMPPYHSQQNYFNGPPPSFQSHPNQKFNLEQMNSSNSFRDNLKSSNSYCDRNNRHSKDYKRSRSRSPTHSSKRDRKRTRSRSRRRSRSRSSSRLSSLSSNSAIKSRFTSSNETKFNRKDRDRSRDNDYYSSSRRNTSEFYRNRNYKRDSISPRPSSSSTHFKSSDERHTSKKNDLDKNMNDDHEKNEDLEVSFVQTTLIPIYYSKDSTNSKKVNASSKLVDLCSKFDNDILARSRKAREKENLLPESTQIPDYRQLLLTKKFDKYTRCTCDQSKSGHQHIHDNDAVSGSKKSKNCKQHKRKRIKSNSSQSDSSRSSSSDSFSSSVSDSSASSTKSNQKDKKDEEDDNFDDIRSMELHRKQNHPERLHPDLSFNEPDQTNEGPLCKCKLKNTTFGTRHQIYYGEEALINVCDKQSNNADKLFHYRIKITPYANFVSKTPTIIEYDRHDYIFEGYSIFSHEPLENIPECAVVIYNHEYKLSLVKEDMIENFTIAELDLLKNYIFVEILELYDLKWKGYNVNDLNACDRFHVMPRFCRKLPYNVKELLSPCEIIKYFLNHNIPVINESTLNKCHLMSNREWLNFVEPLQGSIVTCPGKRPSSLRLDQLDRDLIVDSKCKNNEQYPLIIHFNMFRNTWMPMIKNNMKLKKMYHKYFKMRHLLNNKTKLTTEDKVKLRALGDELQSLISKSTDVHKETMIELSSANFKRTGIRTDIVQQAVLVPTFVEHLRFHLSLKFLEKKIGYTFKNRLLLQFALTHPSGAFLLHQNLGSNSDHIRNVLFNCKVRNPNYGSMTPNKRKNLLRKKGIHMLFSIMSQKANDNEETSYISNYERLEFLGDKILELLISRHLFFLFPMYDEGQLSEYRNAIVQNQYLAVLAKKLDLHYFILFYHGVDLCSNSALNHALANSFEALLAAIFLDSDLSTVSSMLSKTLWLDETNISSSTNDLYKIWTNLPMHPIQAQMPKGDRHLIANTKILQHVQLFEDMIGVEFKHIRLLAQAFCTRSASFNLITLGDNQRLEFLGDTVLNFVVSDYLYRFFPNHHEGHLSLLRSSLVCNSTQALLYDELGMSDFVLTSYINNRKETNGNLKRKADVFEAFIGALYIDQGIEAVTVFCNVVMFNKLQDIILYQFWNDPKSRLQQVCLSIRDVDDSKPSLPIYKLIEEKGPPNHKQYRVAVYFNRKRMGEGIGKSIHDAEVEAAKNALKTKADMFPILNKYVVNELKNSKYCAESFLNEKKGNEIDNFNQEKKK